MVVVGRCFFNSGGEWIPAKMVRLDTLLCPESCSDIVDGVRRLHLERVSLLREGLGVLPGESLDGDLRLWSSSSNSAQLGRGFLRR